MSHLRIEGHATAPHAARPSQGEPEGSSSIFSSCRLAMALVAATEALDVGVLAGRRRSTAAVATARQLAMYLAHVGLGLPQTEVALAFHRDRSTVAHACRRIEDLRDDPTFDRRATLLEASLHWVAGR